MADVPVQGLAVRMELLDDDDDDDECGTWDYRAYDDSDSDDDEGHWQDFSEAKFPGGKKSLETNYRDGTFFTHQSATIDGGIGECWVEADEIYIDHNEIGGFCFGGTSGEPHAIRRRGQIVSGVPGQDFYISKEQRADHERSAMRALQQKTRDAERRFLTKGRNCEAIRSGMGLAQHSGVHTWNLFWRHNPSRNGAADAVGICSDVFEDVSAMLPPCLGSKESGGVSLGLHANGEVYHNGIAIATFDAAMFTVPDVNPLVPSKFAGSVDHSTPAPGLLWRAGCTVGCVLDTGREGGTLSFKINDAELPGLQIKNVFELLGSTEAYPCISLAPPDIEIPTEPHIFRNIPRLPTATGQEDGTTAEAEPVQSQDDAPKKMDVKLDIARKIHPYQVLQLLFDLNLSRTRLDDLIQVPMKDIIELMDQVAAAKTRLQPPYVKIYRPFQGKPGQEGTSRHSPLTASHRCEASMRRTAGAEEEGEKKKAEGSDDKDENEVEEDSDYAGSDAAFEVGGDQRGLDDPIEQVGFGYDLVLTMPATARLDSVAG